jgi:hypothetical protein
MGIFASKTETPSGMIKHHSNEDDRSKATARTEDSSILARISWSRSIPHDDTEVPEIQHRLTWRGTPRSAPNLTKAPRRSRSSESIDSNNGPTLLRRDSDPGAPKKRSMPVKCPHGSAEPSVAEDSDYLVRMYDTRTWEMYLRITEARKSAQFSCDGGRHSYQTSPNEAKLANDGEATSEWENLRHECYDCDGGHAMIFLFDFD